MQTFLSCDLSNFGNDLPSVANIILFKHTNLLTSLRFTDFWVLNVSKNIKVRNSKQTPKVAQIIHM